MSWNYRMTRRTVGNDQFYEVREIYYDRAGNPTSWTVDAMSPFGETKKELVLSLLSMARCLTHPVLDLDTREWLPMFPARRR